MPFGSESEYLRSQSLNKSFKDLFCVLALIRAFSIALSSAPKVILFFLLQFLNKWVY